MLYLKGKLFYIKEGKTMNRDILSGTWNEVKGNIQKKWAELTDDDLQEIEADHTILAGKLEKRYGYAKDRIKEEMEDFDKRYNRDNLH